MTSRPPWARITLVQPRAGRIPGSVGRVLVTLSMLSVVALVAGSGDPAAAINSSPLTPAIRPAAMHSSVRAQPVTPHFDTAEDLASAKAQAERLHTRLSQLQARSDWTNERLAYVRGQLGVAASRSTTAEQQLAELQGADLDASTDLAHRVRAIEQSGGVLALYSEAWEGSSFGDIASNIAALNAVVGVDSAAEQSATAAVTDAALLHKRLAQVTNQRVRLVKRAQVLAAQADRLLTAQQTLLANANQDVRQLSHRLAKEQEAEAAAAAGQFTVPGSAHAGDNPYGRAAAEAALSKLGSPYVWGAEGPDTFDCSGLVQWAYAQAGLSLPRLASDQYFASTPVSTTAMQPGDLLVYAYDPKDQNTIHHIAMYIGNGQMVHAPHTGDVVRVVPVYYDGLYGVGRPGL